jgi:hypothetical protein
MADTFYAGFDSFAYPGDQMMQSLWNNGKEKPKYQKLSDMGWGIVPIYIGYQNRFYARKVGIWAQQAKWKKDHPKETDMPEFTYAAHLDQVPRKLVGAEGAKYGNKAVDLAIAANFPTGSIIYFDCESQDQDDVWMDYFLGWCNAVRSNTKRTYYLGLYAPPGVNSAFSLWLNGQFLSKTGVCLELSMAVWVSAGRDPDPKPADAQSFAEIDPTGCGVAQAMSWQYSFGRTLEWVEDDPIQPGKTRKRVFNPADLNSSVFEDPGNGE